MTDESDFKMPKWQDCTWKRVPCGKDDCKICGKAKRRRAMHLLKGEDPDDMKVVCRMWQMIWQKYQQ